MVIDKDTGFSKIINEKKKHADFSLRLFTDRWNAFAPFRTSDDKIILFGRCSRIGVKEGKLLSVEGEKNALELVGIYENVSHLKTALINLMFASENNIFSGGINYYNGATSSLYLDYSVFFKELFRGGSDLIHQESRELFFNLGDGFSSASHLEGLESQLLDSPFFKNNNNFTKRTEEGYDFFFQHDQKEVGDKRLDRMNALIESSKYSKKEREQAEQFLFFIDNYSDLSAPLCFYDNAFMEGAVQIMSWDKDPSKQSLSSALADNMLSVFGSGEKEWTTNKTGNYNLPNHVFEDIFASNELFVLKRCIGKNNADMAGVSDWLMRGFPNQMFALSKKPEHRESLRKTIENYNEKEYMFAKHITETFMYGYGKSSSLEMGKLNEIDARKGMDASIYQAEQKLIKFAEEKEDAVIDVFFNLKKYAWFKDTYSAMPRRIKPALDAEKNEKGNNPYYDVSRYFEPLVEIPSVEERKKAKEASSEELQIMIAENPVFALSPEEFSKIWEDNRIKNKIKNQLQTLTEKYILQGSQTNGIKNQQGIADSMISLHTVFGKYMENMTSYSDIMESWAKEVPVFAKYLSRVLDGTEINNMMSEKSAFLTTASDINSDFRKAASNAIEGDGAKPYISETALANATKKYIAPKMKR